MNMPGDIVAAKLMIHHLKWRKLTPLELVARYPNARFIVLYRQNLVRQYVSQQLLVLTGQERLRESTKKSENRLEINPAALRSFCSRTKHKYTEFLNSAAIGSERLSVFSYEELAENAQGVFDSKVFPLLQQPSTTIHSSMLRQHTEKMSDLVINFECIRDFAESSEAKLFLTFRGTDSSNHSK
jgi:hypothetical protein